ncbi:MAG: hypothetical protein NTZ25_00230 [Candidatus Peregrinibacteria bacterium]|nr:hypothetical protein [Candidatus Peregrinibacteria bacterium]
MSEAKKISISSVYCNQWHKVISELKNNPNSTNYILSYVFLILTTETYLSGLFPDLLKRLSGKGRYLQIISTEKASRKNLPLDGEDLLESWYTTASYNQLLRVDKWENSQVCTFFKAIGCELDEDYNKCLYDNYYYPLYEIRSALFHRDELVSGNIGPEPFMDKYFTLKKLDETVQLSRKLIKAIHALIYDFIKKTNFEDKQKSPFAVTSSEIFLEMFENHHRSIRSLMDYKSNFEDVYFGPEPHAF